MTELDRRQFVTGLAAVAVAGVAVPALPASAGDAGPRHFTRSKFFVRALATSSHFLDTYKLMHAADWLYESMDDHGASAVVIHLPTGFAYYTERDPLGPDDDRDSMHCAYMLDPVSAPLPIGTMTSRTRIARAAAWLAGDLEYWGPGAVYIPHGGPHSSDDTPDAPPLIIWRSVAFDQFLLRFHHDRA